MKKSKKAPLKAKKTAARPKKAATAKRAVKRPPAKKATGRAKPAKAVKVSAPPVLKLKLSAAHRKKYRELLLQLRDRLLDGINFLASNNLRNSQRDSSGDISSYGTHMADAGTDNFDREFALGLVSNEQEALYEVEEAIKRLEQSTYGICEICEKHINRPRLEALPFARNCVQCQSQAEKDNRRPRRPAPSMPQFDEVEDAEAEAEDEKE